MGARRRRLAVTRLVTAALVACPYATAGSAQQPVPAEGQLAMRPDRGPAFFTVRLPGGLREDARGAAALRRRVSVDLHEVPLAQALKTLSAQTGVHFVYSQEQVTVGRVVSLAARDITLGAALTEVLLDAGVDVELLPSGQAALVKQTAVSAAAVGAIAGRVTDAKTQTALAGATVVVEGTRHSATTGDDGRYRIAEVAPGTYRVRARYIGYAPGTALVTVSADQEAAADFALDKSAQRLEEVVTTGTVAATQLKAVPTPITVITADEIEQKNIQHVDQLFRGEVPGTFAWDQGPNDFSTSFASIRGSTNVGGFGTDFKVYVDGVETSLDDSFIANLDPASIDRIEIVRGPQASTLYGSQALSGVIQIFSKKGATGRARPEVEAKAAVGLIESQFASKRVTAQDYNLQVSGGTEHAAYHLGGTYRKIGAYLPEYGDQYGSAFGGARVVNGPLTAEFSARYVTKTTHPGILPFFPPQVPLIHNLSFEGPQQMYAATLSFRAFPQWEHTAVIGYDHGPFGYISPLMLRTPTDSLGSLNVGDNTRVSLAYHTTLTTRLGTAVSAAWTLGIDHWAYSTNSTYLSETPSVTGTLTILPSTFVVLSRHAFTNTGYYGQLQVGLRDAVFLTAGLRGDQNDNFGANVGTSWAPRVGLSAVRQLGTASVKVRGSYGKAIRPPAYGTATLFIFPGLVQLGNPNLQPEEQIGFDTGLELDFGRRASLQVTYYNQTAKNLIDSEQLSFDPTTFTTTQQYLNLGRVKNTGWEFQGSVSPFEPLTLTGSVSITNSTIDSLGPGYGGNFQVGDRLLGVPHTVGGLTVSYALPRTTVSAGVTYADSWVNVDWVRYYNDLYVNGVFTNPYRSYWITYPAFARIRASVMQQLTKQVSAFVQVENATNRQTGEQDNFSLTAGRTSTVGLRVKY
jgi:outer membrane receptor protein involved in Fe transport